MSMAQEHMDPKKRPDSPPLVKPFEYCLSFLNPKYHIRKFGEDFASARHALDNRDLDLIRANRDALAQCFRGRMLAAYILSGMFGVFGPLLGTFYQYSGQDPTIGYLISLVIANLMGTIGYQVIWYLSHRSLYKSVSRSWIGRFIALERDLFQVQMKGLLRAGVLILLITPVMVGIIEGVKHLSPTAAQIIPFAILGPALEMLIVQSSVLRAIGDLFEKHSWILADTYIWKKPVQQAV